MALATSTATGNEHEARTAALLAIQLMKKHKVVLTVPERKATPPQPVKKPSPPPRRRSTPRGTRRVIDPPERIVAPLGGDCVHCGERYTRGANVFWFASKGAMHLKCFEDWATSKSR